MFMAPRAVAERTVSRMKSLLVLINIWNSSSWILLVDLLSRQQGSCFASLVVARRPPS
jgi:hypothetical protein